MPIYEYRCRDCQKITDAYRSVVNMWEAPDCQCGGKTRKIITRRFSVHSDLTPYYDEHLETHIESKQHRKQVMAEQGVSEKFGQGWHTSAKKHRQVG